MSIVLRLLTLAESIFYASSKKSGQLRSALLRINKKVYNPIANVSTRSYNASNYKQCNTDCTTIVVVLRTY